MKRNWSPDELDREWSLSAEERARLIHRKPIQRLGVAVLAIYLRLEGRFPQRHRDVPAAGGRHVADQLNVHSTLFVQYSLDGRTAEADRAQIRRTLGWRPTTEKDVDELMRFLATAVVGEEVSFDRMFDRAVGWFRERQIEPPADKRMERCIRAAVRTNETALFATIAAKLSGENRRSLDQLVETSDQDDGDNGANLVLNLNDLRADPARPGLESLFREVAKLQRIDAVGLPANLLAGVSPKLIRSYRLRAATEPCDELRTRVENVRYTLLAAFCWDRRREIIDSLAELLIQLVHRIAVNAEHRVEKELLNDLRKVRGKMSIFAEMVDIAVDKPDGIIKEEIYPAVGLETLKALSAEFKASGAEYRTVVQTMMRSSYSSHYRRMLPLILETLVFRSNNESHRPVIEALALLAAFRGKRGTYFPEATQVPIDGVVPTKWRDVVVEKIEGGPTKVNRINYEICVLRALRDGLRCKEIWIEGADRFRNPDEDLPKDFADNRASYYEALGLPLEASKFVAKIRELMAQGLKALNAGMPKNTEVRLSDRGAGGHHISVTPLDRQQEPQNLAALKTELAQRWPATSLLDVLKEAELRVGFTDAFRTTASGERMDRATVQRRLLLTLYGLGTNAGLKRILTTEDSESYKELLYIRRRYVQKTALRAAISAVANATLAVRQPEIWGEGTTACASDSKKFGAWDQNLMTEWHIRYGGRGIMIYWHVERKSVCIYSQLKRCSSSEVAAMIEGVLRHCTDMEVEKNYVDSHGQSEVGFAFSELLGFDLLPRLKNISRQVLYLPAAGESKRYPNLAPILAKSINWDLIVKQYDEMVKYTTALRLGTAESEAILRRFMKPGIQHPTYAALSELGKAIKTIFLCRYLGSRELRQEIHEGLNVIETWNGANGFIFFGKGGEVASNQFEDQEISVLSLHLLQLCMVYVNTLMLQRVLAEKSWRDRLDKADLRALTPLIYNHISPYGRFELDMEKRLVIER